MATDTRRAGDAYGRPVSGSATNRWPAARRAELDFMRSLVVAGLVVFHSAVVFTPGVSWFVKNSQTNAGFAAFLLWGSLWGMPLLFVVSGIGAWHALGNRSSSAFVRERLTRLLVPFLTGLVLLVPPMFYAARLAERGFHQGYWQFWAQFVNIPGIAAGLIPHNSWASAGDRFDPAHLWFLYVLLTFSLVLLPLLQFLRRARGAHFVASLAGFADQHPLIAVAAGALPVMVTEAVFGPDVNTGGWERLTYAFPFVYGFVIACEARLAAALQRARWGALMCAIASTAVLLLWAARLTESGGNSIPTAWSAVQGLAGWAWLAAILGFAGSLKAPTVRAHPSPGMGRAALPVGRRYRAAQYANQAVLPFYVLHEPVIVLAASLIVGWHAPVPVKYLTVVIASLAITLALFELAVRRFRIPRLLLGMKPIPYER